MTSPKQVISASAQRLLVSTVISNGDELNNWLNGSESVLIEGGSLNPTFRTIAFASWRDVLGRLEYVNPENPNLSEFFVPRLIDSQPLTLRGREFKERLFPIKGDGKSIALYLGLKLVRKGTAAIFCGLKTTASGLATTLVDALERGAPFEPPHFIFRAC
ncbi:MAG: hypothetical protein ABIP75_02190 [Pyrinomonadaceae bacterium]